MMIITVAGCIDSTPDPRGEVLIRVRDRVATVDEFTSALSIAQAAYSHSMLKDPVVAAEIRLSVLNQMIEEMMILEMAEIHGIRITGTEADAAVAEFRKDYPEAEFERMLMESAVSLDAWKERLVSRLLAEKVARTVLAEKIELSPEDIDEYYRMQYGSDHPDVKTNRFTDGDEIEDRVRKNLDYFRRKKMETAYAEWLKGVKNEMPVELNQERWKKIIHIR